MIYGIVSLIYLVLFLAVSAMPFYVANRIGRIFDEKVRPIGLRFLFPGLLLCAVAAWTIATKVAFEQACRDLPPPAFVQSLNAKPSGFASYVDETATSYGGKRWDRAIESGDFQFVESKYGSICAGVTRSENPKIIEVKHCQTGPRTSSGVGVHMLPLKSVGYWWLPPIFKAEIQVQEGPSGTVIATATDLIIGGGLVGHYLRLFGGDQDYEYLSCGYASPNIGPWRPSLTSRPGFSQYEDADLAFVIRALTPK